MSEIPFTQFMRPSGRPVDVSIVRSDEISAKAREIIDAGYRFECEVLSFGTISLTITNDDGDADIELCRNGPGVGPAVDRLVERFSERHLGVRR